MIVEPTKIMEAAHFIMNGMPLKDILNQDEVETAILMLADVLLLTGTPRYEEDIDGNS
mgnify:CR=1 FL=1